MRNPGASNAGLSSELGLALADVIRATAAQYRKAVSLFGKESRNCPDDDPSLVKPI